MVVLSFANLACLGSATTACGTAAGWYDEVCAGYTGRGFVGFRHGMHVYIFRRPGEKIVHGQALDHRRARAGPALLSDHGGKRIPDRSAVARPVVITSPALVDVSDMRRAGLLYSR